MKQTINIPFTFEANYTPKFASTPNKAITAWSTVIVEAVSARLNTCKLNLFDNRERVSMVNEYQITYYTSTGSRKHYSIPAASAMEEVLNLAESNDLDLVSTQPRLLTQIIKALYWLSPEEREQKLEGYTFDDLYSVLIEYLQISMTKNNNNQ
jgi:hypothetical protein